MITEHMELSHIKSVFIWESLMSSSFWGKVKKKDDGSTYVEQFKNERFHGKCVFDWTDGCIFSGTYANGSETGMNNSTILNYQVYLKECGQKEF